jgi:hypothetical protein
MTLFHRAITTISCILPLTFTGLVSLSSVARATDYTPDNPAPFTDGIKFRDCADMQKYFNSLEWEINDTVFSGFENQPKTDVQGEPSLRYITREQCFRGYRTQKSPLGTLVCYGYIERRSTKYSNGRYLNNSYSWQTNESDSNTRSNCRYKD